VLIGRQSKEKDMIAAAAATTITATDTFGVSWS
jgi:hypothetical protein